MTAGFLGALLRRAEREPARLAVAIRTPGETIDLSQGRLVADALRWAGTLRSRGASPGDVVLLSLPLRADLVTAFLGALCAGCVPSFMPYPSPKQDPALFWTSHNRLFARLGGGLVVTSAENGAAIATHIVDATMTVITPADCAAAPRRADEPVHAWRPGDIACLQHSSGTTGLKKGVAMTFEAIDAQLAAYADAIAMSRDDVVVSWLPLYHDMGFVACLLLPLALGATTVLLDPFAWLVDPFSLFDAIEAYRGSFAWLPNFAFAHLAKAGVEPDFEDERPRDLASLRALIDCSEACRPETLAAFATRFAGWGLDAGAPMTCYAMAETVFAITQSRPGHPPRVVHVDRAALEAGCVIEVASSPGSVALVSSGTPLAGVGLQFLDEARGPVGPGRVGEIGVTAPFLFGGYHLEPDRSAAAFHGGVFLTRDLGFQLDGELFVLGRRDDQLNILGRNLFANEVETLLADVPGLKPGRVLALGLYNDAIGSQDLVVLAEPDATSDLSALRVGIRARLESVLGLTPKKVVLVEPGWLIKSTSGKISRGENRRKYLGG